MPRLALTAVVFATALLAGCDVVVGALGIESPEKVAAMREAEGKAIGGACRHAGRAIEDCYVLNRKAEKASVFAGWRDMNDYMRENKIEPVAPQVAATQVANAKAAVAEAEPAKASDKPAAKPAEGGKPAKRDAAKAHDS
ncbi:MAG: hypothetical protein ABI433_02005 [Burkholderiaceae bacterium]